MLHRAVQVRVVGGRTVVVAVVAVVVEGVAVGIDYAGEHFGHQFRGRDVFGERNGAAHRILTGGEPGAVHGGTGSFGESVPAAHDAGGVIEIQFAFGAGELGLHRTHDQVLIHGQHQHLVVGEQAFLDRLAERQVMKLGSEQFLVVHGGDLCRVFLGFVFGLLVVDAGCGGHVQPPGGFDEIVVVDSDEVGFR
ncbi:Uncharacterised protein [Mycobacteroides abscessus subsp. abscessus]|nr:Uncharacterised protein [Mycobacteroides abscessus subsp. abscessus]